MSGHEEKLDLDILKKKVTLTLEEIEALFGVPVESVRKWTKRGAGDGIPPLPAFKPGKEILIYREEFERYLKRFPVTAA